MFFWATLYKFYYILVKSLIYLDSPLGDIVLTFVILCKTHILKNTISIDIYGLPGISSNDSRPRGLPSLRAQQSLLPLLRIIRGTTTFFHSMTLWASALKSFYLILLVLLRLIHNSSRPPLLSTLDFKNSNLVRLTQLRLGNNSPLPPSVLSSVSLKNFYLIRLSQLYLAHISFLLSPLLSSLGILTQIIHRLVGLLLAYRRHTTLKSDS